jgi:hypothetical protein
MKLATPILPVFTHSARAVDYLTTTSAANSALKDLAHEPVLGIDSEWRPNYIAGSNPNPTALVQLACPTRILLVHLAAMKRFPAQLFKLLNDEKVVKTGVGVQQDIEKLRRWSTEDAPLVPRSVLELSTLARQANPTAHPGKMSSPIALTKLVEMYLGRKLAKSRKTVMSDWEAFPLNDRQKLCESLVCLTYCVLTLIMQMVQTMPIPLSLFTSSFRKCSRLITVCCPPLAWMRGHRTLHPSRH